LGGAATRHRSAIVITGLRSPVTLTTARVVSETFARMGEVSRNEFAAFALLG
jgi:hypothetical protein